MKKISRTVFGLLGLLIISCATNHAEKPDVSPNTINTQEYSNIEKLLLTKFQYMVISRFSELMLYFGLEKIENDREDFLVYHGTIDTHNVYVRGYFHSDGPTKGIIFLFSVDFEIPRTPEARFLLFEKLSDYISKLYGKPSLSLFEDAGYFIQNGSVPVSSNRTGFKNYVSARNYRDLIIQSESTLVGEDGYFNFWEWGSKDWKYSGFRSQVIGTVCGRARIELKKETLSIAYAGEYE